MTTSIERLAHIKTQLEADAKLARERIGRFAAKLEKSESATHTLAWETPFDDAAALHVARIALNQISSDGEVTEEKASRAIVWLRQYATDMALKPVTSHGLHLITETAIRDAWSRLVSVGGALRDYRTG